jgi:Spy/CpxP family protein refolding chaperone
MIVMTPSGHGRRLCLYMTTSSSIHRLALAALALGIAGATATYAQTPETTSTPPSCRGGTCDGGKHQHHGADLTADEKAQLKAAHEKAVAADPSLQTDQDNLKTQFEALKAKGKDAAPDDRKAAHEAGKAYFEKLQAAELKIDPTLQPVFDKLKASFKGGWHHHHDDGDTTSDSSSS